MDDAQQVTEGRQMLVQVASDRCEGHGRCFETAPSVFVPDVEGFAQVASEGRVTRDDERGAQAAADRCPERAVSVSWA